MKWLAFAGDVSYQFLLSLNPLINFVRRHFGLGYWSLSAYAKRTVKDAVSLGVSVGMTFVFLTLCIAVIGWMFKTGYRLKS